MPRPTPAWPGGICWGLKHVFGDAAVVLYAEPTAAPCCTLALASGLGSTADVGRDLGLDCTATVADGLAVARASQLCCDMTGGQAGGCRATRRAGPRARVVHVRGCVCVWCGRGLVCGLAGILLYWRYAGACLCVCAWKDGGRGRKGGGRGRYGVQLKCR